MKHLLRLLSALACAQVPLRGRVLAAAGQSVSYASVAVPSRQQGAMSGTDGTFSLFDLPAATNWK